MSGLPCLPFFDFSMSGLPCLPFFDFSMSGLPCLPFFSFSIPGLPYLPFDVLPIKMHAFMTNVVDRFAEYLQKGK
jgi:hypothetical protein